MYEIIKFLHGLYDIEVLLPNLNLADTTLEFNEIIKKYNKYFNSIFNRLLKNHFLCKLAIYIFKKIYLSKSKYDLIIGVDQIGLIIASNFAKTLKVPYGLISYEIFFKQECHAFEKQLEIEASQNLDFIVIQDHVRAKYLSLENNIDINKMIMIPVSSSKVYPYKKKYDIYDELKIDHKNKILLFIGSIAEWTCIDKIIKNINKFPDDWVLLLHDRYGDSKKKVEALYPKMLQLKVKKIFFSDMKLETTNDMHKLLHCADLGLATYCPNFKSKYTGRNIEFIGLSSGKISTYLQNGLPIITTKNEVLDSKIKEYNLGVSINDLDEIPLKLYQYTPLQNNNDMCIKFFSENLSFDNFSTLLQDTIENVLQKK